MKNRFINLFILDSGFRLRLAAVLVVIFIQFLLWGKIQGQGIKLVKLRRQIAQANGLMEEIPQLEERLKNLRQGIETLHSQGQPVNFVLGGIFIQNNVPVALIGEDMYRENDLIGGFVILKITPNQIILQDINTQQQTALSLPE